MVTLDDDDLMNGGYISMDPGCGPFPLLPIEPLFLLRADFLDEIVRSVESLP